jgi:hypothetical protein
MDRNSRLTFLGLLPPFGYKKDGGFGIGLKNGENSDNSGFDHVYVLNIHADIELVIKRSFQGCFPDLYTEAPHDR